MGTIGTIISSISSLAAKLLRGTSSSSPSDEDHAIKKELHKLNNTLERIKATLYDAEEREIRDGSVKLWLKELKQVAYDAEDVLDEYQYEVLRAQVESRGDSAESYRKRNKLEPNDLADRIKETISRFDEIAKDRIALQLREEDGPRRCNNETQMTPTSHIVVESNIFGREDEKEKLVNLISSDINNGDVISVVCIVGMGGLGKTSVAQLVYNDPRLRQKFDKLAWICVSEDFNVKRLTEEVIECIIGGSCDMKNLSALQTKLREKIVGKKLFVVLDDVWNEKRSDWELFQLPFLSAELVKVLVTTRNEPVSQIMQTVPSFYLGNLSEKQCWQLFYQYAFGGTNCNERWKLEIGRQILNKCGKLPLAVKSIASLLRHEPNEESWREILESELWELEATKEIFPPLQISYARLPTYLKPCLIYCSMFPKDYNYYIKELGLLWYAQGYIKLKGNKTMEEISQDYVKQLFDRSLLEGKSEFRSKWFTLHDMIHDLARSNSVNECYSIEHKKTPKFPEKIHHLYVQHFDELVQLFCSNSFTALRTLITRYNAEDFADTSGILETHALRAIVFEYQCFGFGFFNSINNLKHLRYISLAYFSFKMLPESICSLYNLQLLTLYKCHNLVELPNDISNLVSLEFLSLEFCSVSRLPESICHLRNLKKLVVNNCKLDEVPEHIGNLVRLEELVLKECTITLLPASFCQLKSLRILGLSSSRNLKEMPREIGSLTNLQTLFVSVVSSLPTSFNKLIGIPKLDLKFDVTIRNNRDEFGWLNAIADLKGTLAIIGLQNIASNLANSKHLKLINTHNLEFLMLSWCPRVMDIHFDRVESDQVESRQIVMKIKNDGSYVDEMDLLLLERLQPHPNLKKIEIIGYRCITFPKWTENPLACASLEEVYLYRCQNLMRLPFSNHQNLKCLTLYKCHSLQLITEFVPSQLQKLIIWNCEGLKFVPGVQTLESLVELKIHDCSNLESLLEEPVSSLELAMHTNDSFYHMLLMGLSNLTSLRILEITDCPKLRVMADELRPVESCIVKVRSCPILREWCLQHDFVYKDWGYEIPVTRSQLVHFVPWP